MKRRLINGTLEDVPFGIDELIVTRGKIVEAIALGGYPQGKKHLLQDDENGKIENADALGMGALNLGASMPSFKDAFDATLWFNITQMNDVDGLTPKQIARKLKSEWKTSLSDEVILRSYDWGQDYVNYLGVKIA